MEQNQAAQSKACKGENRLIWLTHRTHETSQSEFKASTWITIFPSFVAYGSHKVRMLQLSKLIKSNSKFPTVKSKSDFPLTAIICSFERSSEKRLTPKKGNMLFYGKSTLPYGMVTCCKVYHD